MLIKMAHYYTDERIEKRVDERDAAVEFIVAHPDYSATLFPEHDSERVLGDGGWSDYIVDRVLPLRHAHWGRV